MSDFDQFLSKQTFSERIEQMVIEDGCSYIEAILDFASMADKSPEELVPFMTQVLIDKLRKSAYDSGLMANPEPSLEDLM